MGTVIKFESQGEEQLWTDQRRAHGLSDKESIRGTLRALALGPELPRIERKNYLDRTIIICAHALYSPTWTEHDDYERNVQDAQDLLLDFGFWRAKTPDRPAARGDKAREKKVKARASSAPRSYFQPLLHGKAQWHRPWEDLYFSVSSDILLSTVAYFLTDWKSWQDTTDWTLSTAASMSPDEQQAKEVQAGAPPCVFFFIKFWFPHLDIFGFEGVYCEHDFERWCANLQLPKTKDNPYWEDGKLPPWEGCCKLKMWDDAGRPVDEEARVGVFILSNGSELRIGRARASKPQKRPRSLGSVPLSLPKRPRAELDPDRPVAPTDNSVRSLAPCHPRDDIAATPATGNPHTEIATTGSPPQSFWMDSSSGITDAGLQMRQRPVPSASGANLIQSSQQSAFNYWGLSGDHQLPAPVDARVMETQTRQRGFDAVRDAVRVAAREAAEALRNAEWRSQQGIDYFRHAQTTATAQSPFMHDGPSTLSDYQESQLGDDLWAGQPKRCLPRGSCFEQVLHEAPRQDDGSVYTHERNSRHPSVDGYDRVLGTIRPYLLHRQNMSAGQTGDDTNGGHCDYQSLLTLHAAAMAARHPTEELCKPADSAVPGEGVGDQPPKPAMESQARFTVTLTEDHVPRLVQNSVFPLAIRRKCFEMDLLRPDLMRAASRAGSQQNNPTPIPLGYKYDWSHELHSPICLQIVNQICTEDGTVTINGQSVKHTTGAVTVKENSMVVLVPTIAPPGSSICVSKTANTDEINWEPNVWLRIFGPATYYVPKAVSYIFVGIPICPP
ncbi:uncharacterized protein F5Z01DRAFT_640053 [Emericellopsis atlantica]|uniref:Uncharacterized protein n=1 Tax=Emericellopsis atlantica TaxID=2614577 RepID=A0A9P7ZEI3_9HYPO|nr:uncharacterized protein F5Z01DRAFT_640053 [Emericellopsis atlantica]KAG9250643.1 hypothetical protein F5Z01DRAFT_640053 [Emericellopsis atlantica]